MHSPRRFVFFASIPFPRRSGIRQSFGIESRGARSVLARVRSPQPAIASWRPSYSGRKIPEPLLPAQDIRSFFGTIDRAKTDKVSQFLPRIWSPAFSTLVPLVHMSFVGPTPYSASPIPTSDISQGCATQIRACRLVEFAIDIR